MVATYPNELCGYSSFNAFDNLMFITYIPQLSFCFLPIGKNGHNLLI